MTNTLDVVALIEKNPLTKLSRSYQSKFITKIKNEFTESQQNLFVSSFYCYLNHDSQKDFVVDLDNVWKWMEFSRKDPAKRMLEKHFTVNVDYKIALHRKEERKNKGGFNKETILLTVDTFKMMCMLAGTAKSKEVRQYYLKLEQILQQIINEESQELRLQLQQQEHKLLQHEEDKDKLLEKTLLEQFPKNVQCVYYGLVDDKTTTGETIIKFGNSNNLAERIEAHKSKFTNFRLRAAFKVSNKLAIENEIKQHPVLKKRRRSIILSDNKNYTEFLAIDDNNFTMEKINVYIKDIIEKHEYNLENYKLLLQKNLELNEMINTLEKELEAQKEENEKLKKSIPVCTEEELSMKSRMSTHYISKCTYMLYVFQCRPDRYKYGICRVKDLLMRTEIYKKSDPNGFMRLSEKVKYPFIEKILIFLLKLHLTYLGNDAVQGCFDIVKTAFETCIKLEELLTQSDINGVYNNIVNVLESGIASTEQVSKNPEVPTVHKARRPVDQINKDTNQIIATFESLEAAGRAIGVTGTAVGVSLRNKSLCKGFMFRYSGISHEDQYKDQPVIKIQCSTGARTHFPNIAAAAKDCGISAPGLRNRILTNVHRDDCHWVFDKNATHYNKNVVNQDS